MANALTFSCLLLKCFELLIKFKRLYYAVLYQRHRLHIVNLYRRHRLHIVNLYWCHRLHIVTSIGVTGSNWEATNRV